MRSYAAAIISTSNARNCGWPVEVSRNRRVFTPHYSTLSTPMHRVQVQTGRDSTGNVEDEQGLAQEPTIQPSVLRPQYVASALNVSRLTVWAP